MSFWIVTDACCDLPANYIKKQNKLHIVPMSYQIDGVLHEIDLRDETLSARVRDFYAHLQAGKVATTFQVNQHEWIEHLTPILDAGEDVLMVIFSGSLSGMYSTSVTAVQELRKRYPERKIVSLDSRSACMGEGLLVDLALKYRDAGHHFDETVQWVEQNTQRINHWFTVSDLHFLHRGGRLSATSAYVGSILKIKPVLNIDPNGRLVNRMKVQGRKQSLKSLFEKAAQDAFEPQKQTMYVCHSDCAEDARWLAERVRKKLGVPEVVVCDIGPIIGSHTGPGTVAIIYLDKDGAGRLYAAE